jgi:hypothetical protein
MPHIPSLERTEDLIFRELITRGTQQLACNNPHDFIVDLFFEPLNHFDEPKPTLGAVHSFAITVRRDGIPANDIQLQHVRHRRGEQFSVLIIQMRDDQCVVAEHEYLVTIILRYLADT